MERQKTIDEILAMTDEEEEAYNAYCDASNNAGQRLLKVSKEEQMKAIRQAYKMIDNIKKYGVACAEWV